MHSLLIALVPKDEVALAVGSTESEQARQYVLDWLENNGFTGEGTAFCSSPADWCVIGGRWSGELQNALLSKERQEKFNAEVQAEFGDRIRDNDREGYADLFRAHFPEWAGEVPLLRNNYIGLGAEDDAYLLTEELITYLKEAQIQPWDGGGGDFCYLVIEGGCDIAEPLLDQPPADLTGKWWAVAVDYHH